MQADQSDRLDQSSSESRHSTQTMVTAIAVLILAGGAYLLVPGDADEDVVEETAAAPVEPARTLPPQPKPKPVVLEAPDIPEVEETPEPEPIEPQPEPLPPPTPEEIDAQLRKAVADADIDLDERLTAAYSAPWLIDRSVSAADQVARGLVPTRALGLARPSSAFPVIRDGQQRYLDSAGYARYDNVVAGITALPVESLVALFHQFRPQLQEAYASLGYPADAMDNSLIAALDAIIAAPERAGSIELVEKGALYAFADPELEQASDVQKQLLRTGPENTRKLKQWAQAMRDGLLNTAQ